MNVRVGRRSIRISHSDRVVFPALGVTKGEMVDYYRAVAPAMLPHLRGRPLMMQRVHGTVEGEAFYQKEAPAHFPRWIRRVRLAKEGGSVNHVVCDDAATLVYLANQNCITPHVWLSRADGPHRPDRMIFDLDPGPRGAEDARFAAQVARDVLGEAGLQPYLLATGSRGYHVVVPIRRAEPFDGVRAVARDLARAMAARAPDRLTVEARRQQRQGRLYLDYMRNAYAQTAVPPFAIRVRRGATVAVPLAWDELDDADPSAWNVRSVLDSLGRVDPWDGMTRHARSLSAARRWLESGRAAR